MAQAIQTVQSSHQQKVRNLNDYNHRSKILLDRPAHFLVGVRQLYRVRKFTNTYYVQTIRMDGLKQST